MLGPLIGRSGEHFSEPLLRFGSEDFRLGDLEGCSAHDHRVECAERFSEKPMICLGAESGSGFAMAGDAAVDALRDDDCGAYHKLQFDTGTFVASILNTSEDEILA